MPWTEPYSTKEDLRLVIRGTTAIPDVPELHQEAHRFIVLALYKQGMTADKIDEVETVADAMAQLRYAEACKVLHLHYQGMDDEAMMVRASYFERQATIALNDIPTLAAAEDVDVPTFSGGDLNYS